MLTLKNKQVTAGFDGKTGALVELISNKTKWRMQNRKELGLSFRMLVPLPGRRNNLIHGTKQKCTVCKRSADGKRIEFRFDKLTSDFGGEHDISVLATVTRTDAGLQFDMSIKNNSPYAVEAVEYPLLGDVPLPAGSKTLHSMRMGYAQLVKETLLPVFANYRGYYGVDNPIQMFGFPETPFALTATDEEGLYAGCHDTSIKEMVQFTYELKPGYGLSQSDFRGWIPRANESGGRPARLEFGIWHYPYVGAKEACTLAPIELAPYQGTWHRGIDVYKEWRKTWFVAPKVPAWAADVHSWLQIHINSPEDELRCRYTDLVRYGEECAKHGVKAIQLVGWNDGGQDRGNPSHDTDPRLGTRKELTDAIAKIQAMGVKVILFSKFTWADQSLGNFQRDFVAHAAKDPYGNYRVYSGYQYQTPVQLADLNTRRLIPMCMMSKKWRAVACDEFRKVVTHGAAGMLYDECQHHGGANYCFDPRHGHRVPADVFAGDELLCRDFRKITDVRAPDFLYSGEALYDLEHRAYHLSYFRFHAQGHLAGQRYIDPHAQMMAAATGFNDRLKLNGCLMHRYVISYEPFNFKGHLDDFPLTIAYGKKIDELRRRYREFLWDGWYQDTQGAKVSRRGKPFESYTVFRHEKDRRFAAVIVNHDIEKPVKINISFEAGKKSLLIVTPEKPDVRPCKGTITIPAASAAVIMQHEYPQTRR